MDFEKPRNKQILMQSNIDFWSFLYYYTNNNTQLRLCMCQGEGDWK